MSSHGQWEYVEEELQGDVHHITEDGHVQRKNLKHSDFKAKAAIKGQDGWEVVDIDGIGRTHGSILYRRPKDDVSRAQFNDPNIVHRFGNLTSTSASEVLLSARAYAEQASEAQRSVVSTSAQDNNASGSGAKIVRIVYLNSAYELKQEDVTLNGTTPVNTVATDIRFIESFTVIKGAAAAGAIRLMTATGGAGSEFCGIGTGTETAFLCHHYIPAGKKAWVVGWGGVCSDDVNFKLKGQTLINGNLVDTNLDLDNLTGIAAGSRLAFERNVRGVLLGEKTYCRVTVVPGQTTSTVIRGFLDLWEVPL